MSFYETPIFCFMLGAFTLQLLQLIDTSRYAAKKKNVLRYCLEFLSSITLAGIVGYIYFGLDDMHNRIVYFHTGASAPFLMQTLSKTLPAVVDTKKVSTD